MGNGVTGAESEESRDEDLRVLPRHAPREACSPEGAHCFDVKVEVCVVDDESAEMTSEQLNRDLIAGQPAWSLLAPIPRCKTSPRSST